MRRLREAMSTDSSRYPLGVSFSPEETANMPFIHAFGGSWLGSDGSWQGSSVEQVKGLSWLHSLKQQQLIPPDSGGRTSIDVWTAFGKEQRLALAAGPTSPIISAV